MNTTNPFADDYLKPSATVQQDVQQGSTNIESQPEDIKSFLEALNKITNKHTKKKQTNYDLEVKKYINSLNYVHDISNNYYAIVSINGNLEYVPIAGDAFWGAINRFMSDTFSFYVKKANYEMVLNAEKTFIAAKSIFLPYIKRVAADNTHLYIDMRVQPQKFIRMDLTTGEKCYVDTAPFIPRRFGTQKPLPELKQSDGKYFDRFFEMMQITSVYDQCLLLTFLVGKMTNYSIPYLNFIGPQGSGKTTLANFLKNIIDNSEYVSHLPAKSSDLVLLYDQTMFPVLDNVSKINREYADVLCGTYSGHDFKKRKEFTVDEAHSFIVKNSGIITSIESVQAFSDLIARAFYIEFNTLAESGISESILKKQFDELHPFLLDELLDLYFIVHSNYNYSDNVLTLDRSKEFIQIGNIISKYKFNSENLFDTIVQMNGSYRYSAIKSENEIVKCLTMFLANKPLFEGTMTALLDAIKSENIHLPAFCNRPESFAKKMLQSAQVLAEIGISFTKKLNYLSKTIYTIVNHDYSAVNDEQCSTF